MKYRKNSQPQVETDSTKTKMDVFIDDVVDLHKTAFAEIKGVVSVTFEEIKDFDELKQKVNEFISGFKTEVDKKVSEVSTEGSAKFEQIRRILEELYSKKQELLKNAGNKARSLSNISQDSIDGLLTDASARLADSYEKIKAELKIDGR